jgi:hypothetical protein
MDRNVRIRSDPLAMARAFARTPEQSVNFQGFLLYSMQVARGFEYIYQREMHAPPPGLSAASLSAAAARASGTLSDADIDTYCDHRARHPDVDNLIAALAGKVTAADATTLRADLANSRADVLRLENLVRALQIALADGNARGDAALRRDAAAAAAQIAALQAAVQQLTRDVAAGRAALAVAETEAGRLEEAVTVAQAAMKQVTDELGVQLDRLKNIAGAPLTAAQSADVDSVLRMLAGGGGGGGGAGGGGAVEAGLRTENRRLRAEVGVKQGEIAQLQADLAAAAANTNAVVGRVMGLVSPGEFATFATRTGALQARMTAIGAIAAGDALEAHKKNIQTIVGHLFMFRCVFSVVGKAVFKKGVDFIMPQLTPPPTELGVGSQIMLTRAYRNIFGTAHASRLKDAVGDQKTIFKALGCGGYRLGKQDGVWTRVERVAPPLPPPPPPPPPPGQAFDAALEAATKDEVYLFDSYSSFTATTSLALHLALQQYVWYMDMVNGVVLELNQGNVMEMRKNLTEALKPAAALKDGVQAILAGAGGVQCIGGTFTFSRMNPALQVFVDKLLQYRLISEYGVAFPDALPDGFQGSALDIKNATTSAIHNFNQQAEANPVMQPCSAAALALIGIVDAGFLAVVGAA